MQISHKVSGVIVGMNAKNIKLSVGESIEPVLSRVGLFLVIAWETSRKLSGFRTDHSGKRTIWRKARNDMDISA